MARLPSTAEFLEAVEKSNLLGPTCLEPYRGALDKYGSTEELADAMTAEGLITRFQADHLRQGKWQGFFVGTYKILEKLGVGGSAVVYLGEHLRLKQRVAIKVLTSQKAKDAEAVARFEREAKAAAAVRHPHIVHAFDVAVEGRLHYMVMEYVNGVTLLKSLAENGRQPPRRTARQLYQAAQGLHAAHQAGIIHRDVKPSNLMIDSEGAIKVMDLGLARYEADEVALTQGKAILGIAAYTAPEQMAENANVDARSDIYALGATFYLAATGKRPPIAGTPIPEIPPRTPSELNDYRKLLSVIERMMAANPNDRYQSMTEVCSALSMTGLLTEARAKSASSASTPSVTIPSEAPGRPARSTSRSVIDLPTPSATLAPPSMVPAAEDEPTAPNTPYADAAPSVEAVAPSDEEIPYATAVMEVPILDHSTPLPRKSAASLPAPAPIPFAVETDSSSVERDMSTFDFRVQGLFESLGHRAEPAPSHSEVEIEPASQHEMAPPRDLAARITANPWILAVGTFVLVLATLFVLFK